MMTKFNSFATRLDDIVRAALEGYQNAKQGYEKAADKCGRTPTMSEEYASAERALFVAREKFEDSRKQFSEAKREIDNLHDELETAIKAEYLDTFDQLVNIYDRCIANGANINEWDRFTGEIIANF